MGLFMSRYSKFDKTLPDVSGKVFAITGTTSGTGFVAAKTVAAHGGEVLLLNRPSSRSVASLEKLKAEVPEGKFFAIDCDLQDFGSVKSACETIKSKYTSLYCLSNNAGIMATADEITSDGFDKQMQTNHLSHFLLTKELFPLLLASAKQIGDARIVQHSSLARDMTSNSKLEEPFLKKYEKDGSLGGDDRSGTNDMVMKGPQWERYKHSKLANSVFNHALTDRIKASSDPAVSKILSTSAHPGVSQTNLAGHMKGSNKIMSFVSGIIESIFLQSAEDGTMGLLKGMMDAPENIEAGVLYGPKSMTGWAYALPPKPHETDQEAKDMLWKMSEDAIGAKFVIA